MPYEPWMRAPCETCGVEGLAARSTPNPGEYHCLSCVMYAKGLADGEAGSVEAHVRRLLGLDNYKAPEQVIAALDAYRDARIENEAASFERGFAEGKRVAVSEAPKPPDERLLALARALIDLNPANIATIGALSELSGDPGIVVATQQRFDLNERVFLVQREDDRVSRGWAFLRELVAEADARAKVDDDYDMPF